MSEGAGHFDYAELAKLDHAAQVHRARVPRIELHGVIAGVARFRERTARLPQAREERPRRGFSRIARDEALEGIIRVSVVATGIDQSQDGWLPTASAWFLSDQDLDVPIAASGPDDWKRVEANPVPTDLRHIVKYARDQLSQTGGIDQVPTLPRTKLPKVEVSDIEMGTDTISFEVSKPGVPVLVKTSYFPNWKVSGAKGPYRVSPNLMVVIPTDTKVSMHFGRTPVDWLGIGLTLLGLVGLVWLARQPAIAVEPERPPRLSRWIDRQLTIERDPVGAGPGPDLAGPDPGPVGADAPVWTESEGPDAPIWSKSEGPAASVDDPGSEPAAPVDVAPSEPDGSA